MVANDDFINHPKTSLHIVASALLSLFDRKNCVGVPTVRTVYLHAKNIKVACFILRERVINFNLACFF